MIDLALILFIGAVASIGVLIIAPLPIIYIAAFIAFTPILGIVLWRVSAALQRRRGRTQTPSAPVDRPNSEFVELPLKRADATGVLLPPTVTRKST
jgi:hypothetical protein